MNDLIPSYPIKGAQQPAMILSTTHQMQGMSAQKHLGIVSAEVILGANMIRDFFASIRDVVGGRSTSYENLLRRGTEQAMAMLGERAGERGANAVLGIVVTPQIFGNGRSGGMLMISAIGTAKVLASPAP